MVEVTKPEFIEVNKQDRTYYYADSIGMTISNVVRVSASNKKEGDIGGEGHRLETEDGDCFVIASGWRAIRIQFADAKGWTF